MTGVEAVLLGLVGAVAGVAFGVGFGSVIGDPRPPRRAADGHRRALRGVTARNGMIGRVTHIDLGNQIPGIRGLFEYRTDTGAVLSDLGEALLRGDGTLSRGERELIAAYVSHLNECRYCAGSHGACAAAQLPGGAGQVEATLADPGAAPVSAKLRALLHVAARVQDSGRAVTEQDVAAARAEGATDREIHDAVLIAAAFCMFNRYVDGLAALTPQDPAYYAATGRRLAEHGYAPPR
jgi:uncharacterized peroxidase-related enzyme